MLILRKLLLPVAYMILFATQAHALNVSPMQVEMVSAGNRSRAQITVLNTESTPLPVEATIQRLSVDEAGRQQTSSAGEQFLVMPPQAIIPPGATQVFRVQWLGEPVLASSESFLLLINQVPVKLQQSRPGVQVVMSIGAVINIAPPEGVPAVRVVSTGVTSDKSGKRHPTITVENTSNVHALLPHGTIQLSSGSWSSTLPPQSIGDQVGIGLVQPGHRRKFILPVEVPPGVTAIQASVSFDRPRR